MLIVNYDILIYFIRYYMKFDELLIYYIFSTIQLLIYLYLLSQH